MELSDFVKKVRSRGRITFGDIKRLQRDLLPNGAMTRARSRHLSRWMAPLGGLIRLGQPI